MAKVISPVTYLKQVRTELVKVVWPTRQETIKLTIVVIMLSVGMGMFIGGLDIVFVKLAEIALKR